MLSDLNPPEPERQISTRYRFHPFVRFFMLLLASVTAAYSIYFIFVLIPRYQSATMFFKILSVVILYFSLRTIYKHLTSLNSVIISKDNLQLRFLLRKNITIPWQDILEMEIYKIITHYWKLVYLDTKGINRIFKTSLAYPGIINILMSIQDKNPNIKMNELLSQVLVYKRTQN